MVIVRTQTGFRVKTKEKPLLRRRKAQAHFEPTLQIVTKIDRLIVQPGLQSLAALSSARRQRYKNTAASSSTQTSQNKRPQNQRNLCWPI
eukprot:g70511.t1